MVRANLFGRAAAQLARAGDAVSSGEANLSAAASSAASWLTSLDSASLGRWAASLKALAIKDGPEHEHEAHAVGHHGEHPHYKMFREEDSVSWVVFFVLFIVLIIFDNFVLHAKEERLSFGRALAYTVFYMGCAGAFCLYVLMVRGPEDAFNWGTGYLLEWMLSVDNLFVFRSIFFIFRTPDDQKHKPLFWGIVGAVFFRMFFFVIEEFLVHSFWWMYLLLGSFLVYTGIKIATVDEDEEDPSANPVFQKIIEYIPFVDAYAPTAKFFARIPRHEEERIAEEMKQRQLSMSMSGSDAENSPVHTPRSRKSFASDDSPMVATDRQAPLRATRLLLVVVCLEVTDVVFAVDSVSAIVAQIPDLFLAYTACVFAMLGLRAMFFVVDELVHIFSLLSYAVAAILVFIGVKLILRQWIHFPPEIVCSVLVGTLGASIIASIIYDKMNPQREEVAAANAKLNSENILKASEADKKPVEA